MKDVHLAYRRKSFPKLEDVVSFDADIAGKGVSIDMQLAVEKVCRTRAARARCVC